MRQVPRTLRYGEGNDLRFESRCTLERPECIALVGAICAEWASAESRLANMYSLMLFERPPGEPPSQMGAWIALVTFDEINSVSTRLRLLKTAAKQTHLFDDATLTKFSKLLQKLQDAGGNRIVAAHGRWGVASDVPGLVWTRSLPFLDEAEVYEKSDLEFALDKIAKAVTELWAFFHTQMRPLLEAQGKSFLELVRSPDENGGSDD